MATTDDQQIRRELSAERERLAAAVDELRDEIGEATNVRAKLQSKLPLAAGAAFALGFLKGGGIGATGRLVARRSREGDEKAAVGRFRLVRRKS
jgi:hypothetical protein